jgi:hypothetical protein
MSEGCAEITEPRIGTSQYNDASSRCNGSSRPAQLSAFCLFMPPSTIPSTPSVTSPPATRCASSEARHSTPGEMLPRLERENRPGASLRVDYGSCDRADVSHNSSHGYLIFSTIFRRVSPGPFETSPELGNLQCRAMWRPAVPRARMSLLCRRQKAIALLPLARSPPSYLDYSLLYCWPTGWPSQPQRRIA